MAQLSVRDLLSRDFVGVSESDSVIGAVELMRDDGETGAVVLHGSEPVGILSAGDVLDSLANGDDLDETTVSDIMRREPPDLRPEATVDEAASLLARTGNDHVLVANQDGILGVISARDLASITWDPGEPPEEIAVTQTAEANPDSVDTEYSSQSICEACGSLSQDLVNVNGQILCPECRSV